MKWEDRYDSLFQYLGQKHGVPWRMLKNQAAVESSMNPDAENPITHAAGLMQFMGPAMKDVGLKDPRDPEEAIEGASKYMAWLFGNVLRYTHGLPVEELVRWRLAFCSYNCGWGYVKEAIRLMTLAAVPMTWEKFSSTMQTVTYQGPGWKAPRSPKWEECLPYAERIVSDEAVLEA